MASDGRKDVQGQVSGEQQGCSEERKCLRCVEEAIPLTRSFRMLTDFEILKRERR